MHIMQCQLLDCSGVDIQRSSRKVHNKDIGVWEYAVSADGRQEGKVFVVCVEDVLGPRWQVSKYRQKL